MQAQVSGTLSPSVRLLTASSAEKSHDSAHRTHCTGPLTLTWVPHRQVTIHPSSESHQPHFQTIFIGTLGAREALASRLRSSPKPNPLSDAQLATEAFQNWGHACVDHLVGDFAFIVWDAQDQMLYMAKSFLSTCTLYWTISSDGFLFASQARLLLENSRVKIAPNEGYLAEIYSGLISTLTETLYDGIYQLPATHHLTIRPGGSPKISFWHTRLPKQDHQTSFADNAAQFRTLLQEVVAETVTDSKCGFTLSGGLDSSALVCTAEQLAKNGTIDRNWQVGSLVFPGLDCDETDYIRTVTDKWQLESADFKPTSYDWQYWFDWSKTHVDLPPPPNATFLQELIATFQDRRVETLVTGLGGDEWSSPAMPNLHWHDYVRRGQVPTMWRQAGISTKLSQRKWREVSGIARAGLSPLVRPWPRTMWDRWPSTANPATPWLNADWSLRQGLVERANLPIPVPETSSYDQFGRYGLANWGYLYHNLDSMTRLAATFGLDVVHPLNDRRLVEFLLSRPGHHLYADGERKRLLRESMKGILPEVVRTRKTKAEFSASMYEALDQTRGMADVNTFAAVEHGWLNRDGIQKLFDTYEANRYLKRGQLNVGYNITRCLFNLFAVEMWLASTFPDLVPSNHFTNRFG